MKIAFGSDHAGFQLKEDLKKYLKEDAQLEVECYDFGVFDENPLDYPEIALVVAESVARGEFERGVLVCGTGVGMAISANKVSGIRAAGCSEPFTARMTRKHNDANILTLGSRAVGPGLAQEILEAFLATPFEGGRHLRRVGKMGLIEEKYMSPPSPAEGGEE